MSFGQGLVKIVDKAGYILNDEMVLVLSKTSTDWMGMATLTLAGLPLTTLFRTRRLSCR